MTLMTPCWGVVLGDWSFDGNALDNSGNSHHGILIGDATFTSDRFGNPGSALLLDGAGDYVEVAASSDWAFGTSDYTIDFWVQFDQADPWVNILGNFHNSPSLGNKGWSVQLISDGTLLSLRNLGGNHAWAPDLDCWYNLTVQRESGLVSVFVDGALLGAGPASSDLGNASLPLYLGNQPWQLVDPSNEWVLEGKLDDVRIMSHALYPVAEPSGLIVLWLALFGLAFGFSPRIDRARSGAFVSLAALARPSLCSVTERGSERVTDRSPSWTHGRND